MHESRVRGSRGRPIWPAIEPHREGDCRDEGNGDDYASNARVNGENS